MILGKMHFVHLSFYFLLSSPLLATQIKISCPDGERIFNVELAQTPQELERGLMHRQMMTPDEGMLFCFPKSQPVTMWMKNTPLSLDMIFFNEKGEIIEIKENTKPQSTDLIGPFENTAKVLEILGGAVKKQGISKACRLEMP